VEILQNRIWQTCGVRNKILRMKVVRPQGVREKHPRIRLVWNTRVREKMSQNDKKNYERLEGMGAQIMDFTGWTTLNVPPFFLLSDFFTKYS
jgi:hypothetical protein